MLTIVGFLQNFNCVENGFLRNCLRSMRCLCDEIVVYDDASTEDVRPIYEDFDCIVLYGGRNEFKRELYHKQRLLPIALRFNPHWICWIDSDTILGRHWESRDRAELTLATAFQQGIDLFHLHNLNLWRSQHYYRVDQLYNDLWHGVFWRNTGELHYEPVGQLHQKQYPISWNSKSTVASKFDDPEGQLLHFGFVNEDEIAQKYFRYRATGQSGFALDRLVDENGMDLRQVDPIWFPQWFNLSELPASPVPIFSPTLMQEYESYDAWRSASNRQEVR